MLGNLGKCSIFRAFISTLTPSTTLGSISDGYFPYEKETDEHMGRCNLIEDPRRG